MTIDEAIKYVESVASYRAYMPPIREALQMAVDALREKQEAEKNEQLKLYDLYEFGKRCGGWPVWVKHKHWNGWAIVSCDTDGGIQIRPGSGSFQENGYEKTWFAYRRPTND